MLGQRGLDFEIKQTLLQYFLDMTCCRRKFLAEGFGVWGSWLGFFFSSLHLLISFTSITPNFLLSSFKFETATSVFLNFPFPKLNLNLFYISKLSLSWTVDAITLVAEEQKSVGFRVRQVLNQILTGKSQLQLPQFRAQLFPLGACLFPPSSDCRVA